MAAKKKATKKKAAKKVVKKATKKKVVKKKVEPKKEEFEGGLDDLDLADLDLEDEDEKKWGSQYNERIRKTYGESDPCYTSPETFFKKPEPIGFILGPKGKRIPI
jgi:hypothetical protein